MLRPLRQDLARRGRAFSMVVPSGAPSLRWAMNSSWVAMAPIQIGMEVLLNETDPDLVTFELDLYWVTNAGYDPVELMKKHPGRFQLWHVKDMVKSEDKFFAPVGTGRIDFKRIFAEKDTAGIKMFFVEQDSFRDLDPFESVEKSYNYLHNADFV